MRTVFLFTVWARLFLFPPGLSPATGDPVVVIAVIVALSVAAMIALSVLSKRGGGGRKGRRR